MKQERIINMHLNDLNLKQIESDNVQISDCSCFDNHKCLLHATWNPTAFEEYLTQSEYLNFCREEKELLKKQEELYKKYNEIVSHRLSEEYMEYMVEMGKKYKECKNKI